MSLAWLVPHLVPVALITAAAAGWIVTLVDVSRRSPDEFPALWPVADQRMAWAFLLVVTNAVGALFYYLAVMRPYPRRRR